jgi:hypothetical protein
MVSPAPLPDSTRFGGADETGSGEVVKATRARMSYRAPTIAGVASFDEIERAAWKTSFTR